jgi:DNA repair exonuclease SbcCD ATPase subunit
MKIINLKSKNIKGIKAIDITPRDDIVIISGKNGAGKTSALDSIWYVLCWKAGAKETPMPIRKGEKEAEGEVTLCEDLSPDDIAAGKIPEVLFVVNRVWTSNGETQLKVTNGKGLKYTTPQKLLDDFIGYLSFDPRLFSQMKGREQRQVLIDLTGFDTTEIEKKIAFLYDQRLEKGREVKLLTGNREEITTEDLPEELISVADINNELQEAMVINTKIDDAIRNREQALKEIERLNNIIDSCVAYLLSNEKIPVDSLKEKLSESQEINEQVKARDRNRIADRKENKAKNEYDDFTREINDQTKIMEDGLKENWHKIPDQKLSLTETEIAYDGTPYSQISYSEQLKVCIKIGMALNPKLKVLRISDWTLLDNKSKETVRQMSREFGYQIWVEEVDESGTVGFYIEEGEVKAENEDAPF